VLISKNGINGTSFIVILLEKNMMKKREKKPIKIHEKNVKRKNLIFVNIRI
jgi:hypothetical protein